MNRIIPHTAARLLAQSSQMLPVDEGSQRDNDDLAAGSFIRMLECPWDGLAMRRCGRTVVMGRRPGQALEDVQHSSRRTEWEARDRVKLRVVVFCSGGTACSASKVGFSGNLRQQRVGSGDGLRFVLWQSKSTLGGATIAWWARAAVRLCTAPRCPV